MEKKHWKKRLLRLCSYILVAALASSATWALAGNTGKLGQLANVIRHRYIGQVDQSAITDAAAHAMVYALGDRWSYYIPQEEYAAHLEDENNSYVGIGVTVTACEDGTGHEILEVAAEGPAHRAGILPGDIMTHIDGESLAPLTTAQVRAAIGEKAQQQFLLTVLRGTQVLEFTLMPEVIHTPAATGQMLTETVGLVTIENFHWDSAQESIAVIGQLQQQGAQSLVLDVRDNPGGFVSELITLLDYLLPEGPLFRKIDANGKEQVDHSDADCLELPMAVLINGNSYSAAEFFAAALSEYDWAVTVGEPTTGKGYFQKTIPLSDGSAVNLSVGKYATPNGVDLTEAGGLQPDIAVAAGEAVTDPMDDPQILAALQALSGEKS